MLTRTQITIARRDLRRAVVRLQPTSTAAGPSHALRAYMTVRPFSPATGSDPRVVSVARCFSFLSRARLDGARPSTLWRWLVVRYSRACSARLLTMCTRGEPESSLPATRRARGDRAYLCCPCTTYAWSRRAVQRPVAPIDSRKIFAVGSLLSLPPGAQASRGHPPASLSTATLPTHPHCEPPSPR